MGSSKFKNYKENKKKLLNFGIGRLLEDQKENEDLQRYLAEKSYESASLGETSADELAVVTPTGSSGDLEIFRESTVSNKYEEAKLIAASVEQYEKQVVSEHLNLDLYRRKNKSRSNISFNDLTL